jgi:enterochelin esterase-like enzyme
MAIETEGSKLAVLFFGLLIALQVALGSAATQDKDCLSTATGDLEIVPFQSKIFGNTRMLRVLLPPDYHQSGDRKYQVLYLNDGQNLFDICTSIYNREEWRVDETVDALIAESKIRPIIVVGIDNAGRRLRPREYLPYPDDTLRPPEPNPQGKQYPLFLLNEVIPFVESRYRIQTGSANRVLGGSSYGAGVALYTAVARPGSFAGLLLESPSVYASDYQLLKDAMDVRKWPDRIFIGTGTIAEPVDDVGKLESLFRQAGLDNRRLHVVVQQGGRHTEVSWANRFPDALKFLFGSGD